MPVSCARDEILARVRTGACQQKPAIGGVDREALNPQPVLPAGLIERFQDKALAQACTVVRVAASALAPAAVRQFLDEIGASPVAVVTPELSNLDWADAGVAVAARAAVDADQVGISGVYCAIAETGTLMLLSGPSTPATVSLLPETHVALLEAERIVPTMEAAFALLQAEHGQLPRAVNFVSGPSRTGDIEQTIVLGAHGPCRVHVILIGEAS